MLHFYFLNVSVSNALISGGSELYTCINYNYFDIKGNRPKENLISYMQEILKEEATKQELTLVSSEEKETKKLPPAFSPT